MTITFRSNDLTPAEASFLKFQYGFDEGDDPFTRALWQAIKRAWDSDTAPGSVTRHLERLGCAGAYPREVSLYVSFRLEGGDAIWDNLIRRAGLTERRTAKVETPVERRNQA